MKKIVIFVIAFSLVASLAFAGKMMKMGDIPQKAQDCINKLYPKTGVKYISKDFDGYEVRLTNGAKLEFYHDGEWESIGSNQGIAAALMPKAVADSIKKAYPKAKLMKIQKEWNSIEVVLDNGMKVLLDYEGKIVAQKNDK